MNRELELCHLKVWNDYGLCCTTDRPSYIWCVKPPHNYCIWSQCAFHVWILRSRPFFLSLSSSFYPVSSLSAKKGLVPFHCSIIMPSERDGNETTALSCFLFSLGSLAHRHLHNCKMSKLSQCWQWSDRWLRHTQPWACTVQSSPATHCLKSPLNSKVMQSVSSIPHTNPEFYLEKFS